MNCKKCKYFIELHAKDIKPDKYTKEARKYSCSRNSFFEYTEKELDNKMKLSRFCFDKIENRISFIASIVSLIVTIMFGLFGVLPLILKESLSKEEALKLFNKKNDSAMQYLYIKEDTIFLGESNGYIILDSLFKNTILQKK